MGEIITVISDLVTACLLSEKKIKEINTLACNLEESTIGFENLHNIFVILSQFKGKKIEEKKTLTDHKVTNKYDVKCELP